MIAYSGFIRSINKFILAFILILSFPFFVNAITLDPVTLTTPSSSDITSSSVVLTWDETTTADADFYCYYILGSTQSGFTNINSIIGYPFSIPSLNTAGAVVLILLFMFFAFRKLKVFSCIMLVSSIVFFSQGYINAQAGNAWMSGCVSSDKTVLTYTDSGLDSSTTYYYKAYVLGNAFGADGNYVASNEVSVTTLALAPTNVSATAGDGQATIAWDNVSGATSYNIYWGISSGVTTSSGTKITGVTSPYTHTSLTNGTTYYYIVTAENSGGESSASSEVNATALSTPTNVSATADKGVRSADDLGCFSS